MKKMREGYTTGSCVSAAARAGALLLSGQEKIDKVKIQLVKEGTLEIPLDSIEFLPDGVKVRVIKDGGDDPDITHGHIIEVITRFIERQGQYEDFIFRAGKGIGIVTKPGLPVAPGNPAINPGPQIMLKKNLEEFFSLDKTIDLEISVPDGEELAKKTLNPHLGIIGGISILGTTGIVKPMSEEAFKVSLVPQLKTAKALGYKAIVLTPGNIGMESAMRAGVPRDAMVITSNFIGYMLENALDVGFEEIILWGHIGKLVKIAGGNFYTHNRISDSRMEILMAHLALNGAPRELIEEVSQQITTEAAWDLIEKNNYGHIAPGIAEKASDRSEKYLFSQARVGTVLLKNRDDFLFANKRSIEIGEKAGWELSL